MSVRCGNPVHKNFAAELERTIPHHDSVAQVKLCYAREGGIRSHEEVAILDHWAAESEAEIYAENAWLRHAESAGWEEAELDRQMEDRRGVIQFSDALAASEAANARWAEHKNEYARLEQEQEDAAYSFKMARDI